jgi:hypothetical protein
MIDWGNASAAERVARHCDLESIHISVISSICNLTPKSTLILQSTHTKQKLIPGCAFLTAGDDDIEGAGAHAGTQKHYLAIRVTEPSSQFEGYL